MYLLWRDSCRLLSKVISCQINFFAVTVVTPPRKHHTRWFFESHSRGNRRIVLRNQPEYRGAYAFNRIVNPFLSSVRAEQLENCMQMQKYSGESARAPWFLIDSRRTLFLSCLFCSPILRRSHAFPFSDSFTVFDYLFFLSFSFYWLDATKCYKASRETKFWSRYSLFSFLWFRNRVLRDSMCVPMMFGSIGPAQM